ncbi:hypothetical protein M422DRAFT_262205 [Sphaerobolus stellatus SS14]|uniref:DUF6534 domain-containing protein n=1 Tax=Sphaerobolus stellatus (strain SS14) TaxID=990650 RepID=A0A0C9UL35_SPHS4|nr:hypothetical protein M422DRAFT_262205 [Sphaerobolus stellatus SS14]
MDSSRIVYGNWKEMGIPNTTVSSGTCKICWRPCLCILGASALAMVHSVIPYNLTLGFNLQLWQRYTNSIFLSTSATQLPVVWILLLLPLCVGCCGKADPALRGRMAFIIINTGLSTAVTAILVIVTLIIWPRLEIFTIPYAVICPLYCNTILANLNSRAYMRSKTRSSFMIPSSSGTNIMRRDMSRADNAGNVYPLSIFIETSMATDYPIQIEVEDEDSLKEHRSNAPADKDTCEGSVMQ